MLRTEILIAFSIFVASCGSAVDRPLSQLESLYLLNEPEFNQIIALFRDPALNNAHHFDRDDPAFDALDRTLSFRRVQVYSPAPEELKVGIIVHTRGLSVSGVTTGFFYSETGHPTGGADWPEVFDNCADADDALETPNPRLQVVYCRINDRWFAFRMGN